MIDTMANGVHGSRARRLFALLFSVVLCGWLLPAVAHAQTPARCGFSLGAGLNAGVHTDPDLRDEFPYVFGVDLETKYYLWKVLSLAEDFGFLYAAGRPKEEEFKGKEIPIHYPTRSYLRSGTGDLLLRVEIGRYWRFNPYLGGGAGGLYNTLARYGIAGQYGVTNSYAEWLWHYVGLVGFDYLFDKYVALKFEARWTFAPSRSIFVDKKDVGLWTGVLGLQIYL